MPPQVQRRNPPEGHWLVEGTGERHRCPRPAFADARGHNLETAAADGMHFIDARFRPWTADTCGRQSWHDLSRSSGTRMLTMPIAEGLGAAGSSQKEFKKCVSQQ